MSNCKADLQARLDDAKSQYHLFRTGQLPRVVVTEDGQRVEFNNAQDIKAYIDELNAELTSTSKNLPPVSVML